MNRENKRKTFEKGYYKTHACNDTFTCKVCGGIMEPVAVWVRKGGSGPSSTAANAAESSVPTGWLQTTIP